MLHLDVCRRSVLKERRIVVRLSQLSCVLVRVRVVVELSDDGVDAETVFSLLLPPLNLSCNPPEVLAVFFIIIVCSLESINFLRLKHYESELSKVLQRFTYSILPDNILV